MPRPRKQPPTWVELEAERRWAIKRAARYGVTPDQLVQIKAEQGGACAICRRTGSLVVDHDHVLGTVRGLLCSQCNMALGLFGENVLTLAKAIFYLGRARGMEPDVDATQGISDRAIFAARRKALKEGSENSLTLRNAVCLDQCGAT